MSLPGPTIGKRDHPAPSCVCRHLAIERDELITNTVVLVLATEDEDSSGSKEVVPIYANILYLELDALGTRTTATDIEDSLQGLESPPTFNSAVVKETVSRVVERTVTTDAEGDQSIDVVSCTRRYQVDGCTEVFDVKTIGGKGVLVSRLLGDDRLTHLRGSNRYIRGTQLNR